VSVIRKSPIKAGIPARCRAAMTVMTIASRLTCRPFGGSSSANTIFQQFYSPSNIPLQVCKPDACALTQQHPSRAVRRMRVCGFPVSGFCSFAPFWRPLFLDPIFGRFLRLRWTPRLPRRLHQPRFAILNQQPERKRSLIDWSPQPYSSNASARGASVWVVSPAAFASIRVRPDLARSGLGHTRKNSGCASSPLL
jgi:hypothetical protein